MSFSAAYTLAEQRGLAPATFKPGNSADEQAAAAILADAIPATLKQGWDFLARLAPVVRESGKPWDVCLHCTVAGKDDLAVRANIGQPGLKHPGVVNFDETGRKTILKQVARLSMFDIPRNLVGEKLGLWPYHLFGMEVLVLSPTPELDITWAMQRHAVRVRWHGKTPEPETLPYAASAEVVKATLTGKHAAGWAHLMSLHEAHQPGGQVWLDESDTFDIAEHLHHIIGSVTGRHILCEATGRNDWHYYNCHSPAGGDPKPSPVLQLQNQHPMLEHC